VCVLRSRPALFDGAANAAGRLRRLWPQLVAAMVLAAAGGLGAYMLHAAVSVVRWCVWCVSHACESCASTADGWWHLRQSSVTELRTVRDEFFRTSTARALMVQIRVNTYTSGQWFVPSYCVCDTIRAVGDLSRASVSSTRQRFNR
jgi:hypothetical protein